MQVATAQHDTSPTDAPLEPKRTNIELVLLRHCDYRAAEQMYGVAALNKHVRACESMVMSVARRFWGAHEGHPNRVLLRKASIDLDDVANMARIWAGGFARYDGLVQDGRLWRFLCQRGVELMDIVRRIAGSCSPDPAGRRDELEDATVSQSSRSEDGDDRWRCRSCKTISSLTPSTPCCFKPRLELVEIEGGRPRIKKLHLLEKLAAYTDEAAAALLGEQEQAQDTRSQGGRLMREVGSCADSGACALCHIRRRQPDLAILCVRLRAPDFRLVRRCLEHTLSVPNARWQRVVRRLGEDATQEYLKAARSLGLLGINSDGSLSPTRLCFELLRTAAGSPEEREFLFATMHSAPSLARVLEDDSAPLQVLLQKTGLSRASASETANTLRDWLAYASSSPHRQPKEVDQMSKPKTAPAPSAVAEESSPDKNESGDVCYPTTKSVQGDMVVYAASIPVDDLFHSCFVQRYSPEIVDSGYQRPLDQKKADAIAAHLDEGGAVPGCVVVAARPEAELQYDRKNKSLSFKRGPGAFAVIDGQHRLNGHYRTKSIRHRVFVQIYEPMPLTSEARLFLQINHNQKPISKELLKNVASLAGTESEAEAELRAIFEELGRGPLKGGRVNRSTFDVVVGKVLRSDLLLKFRTAERRRQLIVAYVRAFHEVLEDKRQTGRSIVFSAMMDALTDVVAASKRQHGTISEQKLAQTMTGLRGLAEKNFPGAGKRQQIFQSIKSSVCDSDLNEGDLA